MLHVRKRDLLLSLALALPTAALHPRSRRVPFNIHRGSSYVGGEERGALGIAESTTTGEADGHDLGRCGQAKGEGAWEPWERRAALGKGWEGLVLVLTGQGEPGAESLTWCWGTSRVSGC